MSVRHIAIGFALFTAISFVAPEVRADDGSAHPSAAREKADDGAPEKKPGEDKPAPPAIDEATRQALIAAWQAYAQSEGKDNKQREQLLDKPEAAVAVLFDLLHGEAPAGLSEKEVEALVKQLADEQWSVREAATKKLIDAMPTIRPLLLKHRKHPDAEVRARIEQVLRAKVEQEPDKVTPEQAKLRSAATDLLRREVKPDVLRKVARARLDQLAMVNSLPRHWDMRPSAVLIAALRHSEDEKDRALLGEFVPRAQPAIAAMTLDLMDEGLTNLSATGLPEHWKKLPKHDYHDMAMKLLDPKQPGILVHAMKLCRDGDALKKRLLEILPQLPQDITRTAVVIRLWQMGEKVEANEFQRTTNFDPRIRS